MFTLTLQNSRPIRSHEVAGFGQVDVLETGRARTILVTTPNSGTEIFWHSNYFEYEDFEENWHNAINILQHLRRVEEEIRAEKTLLKHLV